MKEFEGRDKCQPKWRNCLEIALILTIDNIQSFAGVWTIMAKKQDFRIASQKIDAP